MNTHGKDKRKQKKSADNSIISDQNILKIFIQKNLTTK